MSEKTKQELNKMHWRDRYEYEASQSFESTSKLSEKSLIDRAERNQLDPYFSVWKALATKGTIANAAMPMWHYLQRSPGEKNMLNRYHCSAALFQILGIPDPTSDNDLRKQVQWDNHGEQTRQEALLRLKAIIEEKQSAAN